MTCPWCDASPTDNCAHLLAVMDRTNGGCVGGEAADSMSLFHTLIRLTFRIHLARTGTGQPAEVRTVRAASGSASKGRANQTVSWTDRHVTELWEDVRGNCVRDPQTDVELDDGIALRLITEVLIEAGGDEARPQTQDKASPQRRERNLSSEPAGARTRARRGIADRADPRGDASKGRTNDAKRPGKGEQSVRERLERASDEPEGPGASSVLTVLFAERPVSVCAKAVSVLHKRLEPKDPAHRSSETKSRSKRKVPRWVFPSAPPAFIDWLEAEAKRKRVSDAKAGKKRKATQKRSGGRQGRGSPRRNASKRRRSRKDVSPRQ